MCVGVFKGEGSLKVKWALLQVARDGGSVQMGGACCSLERPGKSLIDGRGAL